LLAPLAADRAGRPPTSSSLADGKRVGSLLLSTEARDPLFDCSLSLAAMFAGLPPSAAGTTASSACLDRRVPG
jgi:hypothetical protein